MDRYIVRGPKTGIEYPQGNQMITFSATSAGGSNITATEISPHVFGSEAPQPVIPRYGPHTPYSTNVYQNQGQVMSGIDPRYLASYSENNATYIDFGEEMRREQRPVTTNLLCNDYQKRISVGLDRKDSSAQRISNELPMQRELNLVTQNSFGSEYQKRNIGGVDRIESKLYMPQRIQKVSKALDYSTHTKIPLERREAPRSIVIAAPKNQTELDLLKSEVQNQVKTRSEKLKELHKTGTRIFSGPVEKILKWNKTVQEIGATVLFEIVGKCVSIRPGESCAKNLVVRDENGPAIQVVYYEIDFLLPDLKVPSTVRVIGRMMPGTCRLQAFSVRAASGDDVATLPRRAAVAAHHVTKLSKEYGQT